jgi:hypothetical protein
VATELREIAKRSKNAIIAFKLYENWRVRRRFERGDPEWADGSTHLKLSIEESLAYINSQYDDYIQYGGLTPATLRGKRILELGFGDNVGVCLKFLAVCEVAQAVCLDKFYATRDEEQQRRIYVALRGTLNEDEKRRFDEAIDLTNGVKINPERLQCIYGVNVEDSSDLANGEPFDLIVSRGMVQDVYEPEAAFATMDRLLSKDGLMLHKIDLSDQKMFSNSGLNPLTFLTIPEGVYRRMVIDSGRPNRKMVSYYRQKMTELGYESRILITEVIGRNGLGDLSPHREKIESGAEYVESALKLVTNIRPRLRAEFSTLPDGELIVGGIFLIAKKPN